MLEVFKIKIDMKGKILNQMNMINLIDMKNESIKIIVMIIKENTIEILSIDLKIMILRMKLNRKEIVKNLRKEMI